jgi:hypothetical protein
LSGRLIEVVERDGALVVAFPDVPAEFAPRLVRRDGDPPGAWEMAGGPYHGLTVERTAHDGADRLLIGRTIALPPWRASPAVIRGLPAEPECVDADTVRRYAALLDRVWSAGGGVVDPPPGLELSSWVRWLSDQGVVLYHGSPDPGHDVLVPRRTSYELDDAAERGNRAAVYATDDGWWAMWFAVIDRDRLRGSMRSGVETFTGRDGRRLRVHHFSVDYRVLPSRPLRDGWLYLVPRDTFIQLPVLPGGPPSAEWCSEQAVTPLARLPVRVADFPFHDRISGHDDGHVYRYGELAELVRKRVVGGVRTPAGVALRLRWDDVLAAVGEEYLGLGRQVMPDVERSFHRDGDGVMWLRLGSSGPLVLMLQNSHADLIDADR